MAVFRKAILLLAFMGVREAKRPHIVFMIVDDLGWSDVSFHGSKQIPTPNVDSMARDGIILNQYYVQPTCSPSRGALMTGKYPIRFGFQHEVIKAPQAWGLPLREKILPQYLKSLKYTTHAVGKWHLGFFREEYLPQERGFDSFFGYYTGVEDYFSHVSIARGNYTGLDLHCDSKNVWKFNGTYGTELFTAKAKNIILNHDPTKPMFLYFAQQTPHSGNFDSEPIQVPDKYVESLVGIHDHKRKRFAGMVQAMDQSVGEIVDALEKSGMIENTIFIFTTDNGGAVQDQDGTMGSNFPLRGSKYNLWEGSTRAVGFIWSPFLRHRSRIHNGLMHITDWLPTILSAAGGPVEMLDGIDGFDQWPSLAEGLPSRRSEILLNFDEVTDIKALRKGRFKYVKGSYYEGKFDGWYDTEGKPIEDAETHDVPHLENRLYKLNYLWFLKRSKAARVLWRRYRRNPRLAMGCLTPECSENLEVRCGLRRPIIDTCDPKKGACLFDIVKDPCEFYNIADQMPGITAYMEKLVNAYKPFIVPAGEYPADPLSDPIYHGNAWVPWR